MSIDPFRLLAEAERVDCKTCKGLGQIRRIELSTYPCQDCQGTGKVAMIPELREPGRGHTWLPKHGAEGMLVLLNWWSKLESRAGEVRMWYYGNHTPAYRVLLSGRVEDSTAWGNSYPDAVAWAVVKALGLEVKNDH